MSKPCLSFVTILVAVIPAGCSTPSTKAAAFTRTAIQPAAALDSARPEKAIPNLDEGIARHLDAAFLGNRLHVKYEVSDHVVTLTGDVNSQSKRARAERVAAAVVNVQQVVNELRVRTRRFGSAK